MAKFSIQISLLILASLFFKIAYAQEPVPTPIHDTIITDTVTTEVLIPLRQRVADEIKKNITQLNADKVASRQNELLNNILKESQKANEYLEDGLDTAGIASQLNYILALYDVAVDGIFINKGTSQTDRNLGTSYTLLKELLNRTHVGKRVLDSYLKSLVGFQNNIDLLASDSIMMELPSDSVSLANLISKVNLVTKEMRPADTLIKKAIQKVQQLQTRVNLVTIKLEDGIEKIEKYREDLASNLSKRETVNLWGPVAFRRPFAEIYSLSKEKARLVFSYYSKNNSGRIVILFLLIASLSLFLRNLKKRYLADQSLSEGQQGYLVLRYPFLSSILIILCIFQFIFPAPPFVFTMLLWVISVLSLTVIFRNAITKYWKTAWLIMVLMFFLAVIDNLILQSSRIERYGMLLLALAGVTFGLYFLIGGRHKTINEKGVRVFMALFILMELAAVIANLLGRYNFAKTCLTSGIFGLVNAILFFWVIRFVNEMISASSGIYKKPDKKSLLVDTERPMKKASRAFYILLLIGWVILFGRSFYFFRKITAQFTDYMNTERKIGEHTFTIQSIFIFFVILFLSGLISSIVTFFASGDQGNNLTRGKKSGLGSWILLIRIAIIIVGVLLAFAAAGIPMDRLAIILGALSVGIGFGLQSLVNNLVSGLILAFEKPINVGDVVEFGGQTGTMKSIGFRSSIIRTWDGADVIIPNGNLLSEKLINWTMGNSNRRVEIVAEVAYGTDCSKAKKILLDLLATDKRVMTAPPPLVLIKDLKSSIIEIRILFWIENFDSWNEIKSDLIEAIDEAFKKEGIQIPGT